MEFILSKIISRSPRTAQSDCDITIVDKNDFIDVPSDSAENTKNHQIDNGFNDNASLSGDIDTVNSPPKCINCVFASFFLLICGVSFY